MTDASASPPPPPPSPPASPPPSPPASPPSPPPSPHAGKFYDGADIDDELRVHFEANGYKSWADVAKSDAHKDKLLGADKATLLRLPKDRSDPAQWAEINKALGFAPTVEEALKGLQPNEALGFDRDTLTSFLTRLHGKNPADLPKLAVEWSLEMAQALDAKVKEADELRQAELDRELGKMFGDAKDERIAGLNALVREHGGEDFAAFLEESGLGNDLRMIKFVNWAFENVAEKTELPGGRPGTGGAMTPAEAEAQLRGFESANAGALNDRNHPDHKALVKQRQALIEKAYPKPQR